MSALWSQLQEMESNVTGFDRQNSSAGFEAQWSSPWGKHYSKLCFLSPYVNSASSARSGGWASLWEENTHQAQPPVLPGSDCRAGDVGTAEAAVKSQLFHFLFLVPLLCLVYEFGARDCFPAGLAHRPCSELQPPLAALSLSACTVPSAPAMISAMGRESFCYVFRSIIQWFWSTLTLQIDPTEPSSAEQAQLFGVLISQCEMCLLLFGSIQTLEVVQSIAKHIQRLKLFQTPSSFLWTDSYLVAVDSHRSGWEDWVILWACD